MKRSASNNPLVSIITPVLNGVKYLEPCIQSVLNQSYPYIEHILVDGGSTDGSVEMLSSYQAKYPARIRFISEPDEGVGVAWNKGIRMANGRIFGWLGSDDMYEPDAIQTVAEFFKMYPEAYFVFGDCNIIDEKGELISTMGGRDFDLNELINDYVCVVPAPASFYRREVIDRVGFYDAKGNDYEFLIRVGEAFPIRRIGKVLANFRRHKGSQTGARKTYMMWRREDYLAARRHGASIFSRHSRKYFKFVIIERLRPVLGFAYPFINRLFRLDKNPLSGIRVIR